MELKGISPIYNSYINLRQLSDLDLKKKYEKTFKLFHIDGIDDNSTILELILIRKILSEKNIRLDCKMIYESKKPKSINEIEKLILDNVNKVIELENERFQILNNKEYLNKAINRANKTINEVDTYLNNNQIS